MSESDAVGDVLAAWRTLSEAARGRVEPQVVAAGFTDRRSLEHEVESAELALVWIRSVAETCRDRLVTEAFPDARS